MSVYRRALGNVRSGFAILGTRRMATAALLGFASGLPLFLTGQVLVVWMASEGVTLETASAFASVGLPYTFKWAWAPLFDRFTWPWLGRRRGWIVALELLLMAAIGALALVGLAADAEVVALLAVALAAASASHDVVVDAFLTESLAPDERPAGSAAYVLGYRSAMLAVGGGGFLLAARTSWPTVYVVAAALVPVGAAAALLLPEPAAPPRSPSLVRAITGSVWELFARPGAIAVVIAVATFRFGELLVLHVQGYFLVQVAKIDVETIGWVTQAAGFAGLAAGGTVLSVAAPRLGPRVALYVFGATAAAANLGWAILAWRGASRPLFLAVAFVDSFGTALASGAFVAFLMGQCSPGRAATQYALLNALSSMGGRGLGFVIAPLVAALGWAGFYAATAAMMVPALIAFAFVPRARFQGTQTLAAHDPAAQSPSSAQP